MSMLEFDQDLRYPRKACVKVLGLGGAGCNTINRLSRSVIPNVTLAAANTDAQSLSTVSASEKIILGASLTRGLGCGGDAHIGRQAAEEAFRELIAFIKGSDFLFLTTGMGGGTGSGAIEIAARIARSLNVITITVVTLPFSFESGVRTLTAMESVARLKPFTDTLITIPNDRLIALAGKSTTLVEAFAMSDDFLTKALQGLSAILNAEGALKIDVSHVLRLMRQHEGCFISTGEGIGPDRIIHALNAAWHHPLFDDIPILNAKGIIAKLDGNISLDEIQSAGEYLQNLAGAETETILAVGGSSQQLKNEFVQATLLLTGVGGIEMEEYLTLSPPTTSHRRMHQPNETTPHSSLASSQTAFTSIGSDSDALEVPAFLRNSYNLMDTN